MKRKINFLSAITLFLFVTAACSGQTGRTDAQDKISDFREDLQEVIQNIDEAIATNDISKFKKKTDDVISSLDNKIDDYLTEMDNSETRINQSTRNQIIEMKQKKVEVEFKLALLEQDDFKKGDGDHQQNQTGTKSDLRKDDDRSALGTRQTTTVGDPSATGTRQTTTVGDRSATGTRQTVVDDRSATGTHKATTDDARSNTGTRQSTTDDARTSTDTRQASTDYDRPSGTDNNKREILYGQQLVDDLKSDLRDLKINVEQFSQASLQFGSVAK